VISRCRNNTDINPLFELNMLQAPAEGVKFLFDSEDLLETGLAIQSPNMNPIQADRYLGLLKLNLPVMDLDTAIETFAELACTEPQFGVDDGHVVHGAKFCAARHDEGEAVIAHGSMVDARIYARRGCSPGLRAKAWRRAVGLFEEAGAQEEAEFLRLRVECDRLDLLTDELFLHDIQTVLDEPRYFIFDVSDIRGQVHQPSATLASPFCYHMGRELIVVAFVYCTDSVGGVEGAYILLFER
jgi:hypothetical protein